MSLLESQDLALIRATQEGLPLVSEPYQELGRQLNMSSDEVMSRLIAMQQHDIIRRIGVVPNHYRLGYRFNGMTVWNVRDDRIDDLGAKIGQLDFVSHCYHRPRHLPEWPYNLFVMVHGKAQEAVDAEILQISELLGKACLGSEVLYSTKILKKTGLRLSR